jgi:hypothetical protein
MSEESPTRPGVLLSVPPVEVAAARLPRASRATAPTVSWLVNWETNQIILSREGCLRAFVVVEDMNGNFFRAGEGFVFQTGGFTSLGKGEAFALAVEHQFGVVDEGHAVGVGELLSAFSDEVDVRAFFQDQAGGLDGIAEALDTGHAAGLHAAAVHEQGVELDAAIGGEESCRGRRRRWGRLRER